MSKDEGTKDEKKKTAEQQKSTGKRPSGLVEASKEDLGPCLKHAISRQRVFEGLTKAGLT